MQFSKFMPLVCAAAFCAGFITARAEDNPAQAAARVALEEKMRELDAQEAATNAEAPPAIVVTPSGATQEQPSAPAAAVTTTPAPAESQPAATAPTETQPASPTTSSGIDASAAARAVLDQKMHELDAQQTSTNAETPTVSTTIPSSAETVQTPVLAAPPAPPQASANYPGKDLGLNPIEAPAPPISADKQAQLQTLLAKYMADQITPEEYHKQRAEILAEP
jgi:hypothetical protein